MTAGGRGGEESGWSLSGGGQFQVGGTPATIESRSYLCKDRPGVLAEGGKVG